jgi:hypothetical protein
MILLTQRGEWMYNARVGKTFPWAFESALWFHQIRGTSTFQNSNINIAVHRDISHVQHLILFFRPALLLSLSLRLTILPRIRRTLYIQYNLATPLTLRKRESCYILASRPIVALCKRNFSLLTAAWAWKKNCYRCPLALLQITEIWLLHPTNRLIVVSSSYFRASRSLILSWVPTNLMISLRF